MIQNFNHSDIYFVPATYPQTFIAIKVTAGITCILSILGASLIILTYVAFKDLRTIARQLLVNLSVADIILCLSHFVGLWVNNTRFLPHYNPDSWNTSRSDPLCITQGAFTVYSTIAGFLWSILIAVYLLVLIMSRRPVLAKCLVPAFYCIGWGIPVILIIVSSIKQYFGYEPVVAGGWCSTVDPTTGQKDIEFFIYDIWVYISFGALLILYLILFVCMRLRKANPKPKGDFKLLFVPLIFFLLRIWSPIIDIGYYHVNIDQRRKFRGSVAAAVMLVFDGIGLSAQGVANAILFCVFTKEVRKKLLASLINLWHCGVSAACSHCQCKCRSYNYEEFSDPESLQNESSSIQLENSVNFGFNRGINYGSGGHVQKNSAQNKTKH